MSTCLNLMLVTFFVMLIESITCLKLLELRVPAHVPHGTRTQLTCRWELASSELLYSVKWYKDGKEFFRHVPRNQDARTKFKLPGVEVDEFDPSGSNLTLAPASLETSGRYRCEVSGEKPLFPTVSDYADMEVIVLPDHGPILSGLHSRYQEGDRMEVTCTSGRSWPATQLGWYINGEPAPINTVHVPTYKNDQGLKVTRLILDFNISETHFVDGRIKIKCLATLSSLYWKSNEESTMQRRRSDIQQKYKVESTHIVLVENPITYSMRIITNTGCKPAIISEVLKFGTIVTLLSVNVR